MKWPRIFTLMAARCTRPRLIDGAVLVHLPPEPLAAQAMAGAGPCRPIASYVWDEENMLSCYLPQPMALARVRIGLVSANDTHLVLVEDDSVGDAWVVAALPSADRGVVRAFLSDFEANSRTEYGVAVFDRAPLD